MGHARPPRPDGARPRAHTLGAGPGEAWLLPEHGELLARAKASRLGDAGEPFTVNDGYAACDLVDAVVSAARL